MAEIGKLTGSVERRLVGRLVDHQKARSRPYADDKRSIVALARLACSMREFGGGDLRN